MAATKKSQAITPAEWGGKTKDDPGLRRHYPTLPSGAVVGIEIPDLPELIKSGQIPNDLVETAIQSSGASAQAPLTREDIEQQPVFYRLLVKLTVKEPVVDDELYDRLPTEDKEMIVEFATRQRDLDAVGKHLGGLHTSKEWRQFRGLDFGGSALDNL